MGALATSETDYCSAGEMLKFLGCLLVALGAVLSIPMEMTTTRPEATTEDTSGRLLSLPDPVKCAQRPKHFEHGGHSYWFSGDEENFTDHKVDWLDGRNICREYCMDLVSLETPTDNAEFDINGSVEACMGLLNDIYSDGVKWHDIACYHTKPFICEDSDQLLE